MTGREKQVMVNDKVSDGEREARTESNTVSSHVYSDREDFANTLRVAGAGQTDNHFIRAFDGPGGGPVIVDTCQDSNGDGRNSVTSTVEQEGHVVSTNGDFGVSQNSARIRTRFGKNSGIKWWHKGERLPRKEFLTNGC